MSHLSSPIQQDCIPCLLSVAALSGLIILIWSGGCLLASAAAIYRPRKILQSWSLQTRPHYVTLETFTYWLKKFCNALRFKVFWLLERIKFYEAKSSTIHLDVFYGKKSGSYQEKVFLKRFSKYYWVKAIFEIVSGLILNRVPISSLLKEKRLHASPLRSLILYSLLTHSVPMCNLKKIQVCKCPCQEHFHQKTHTKHRKKIISVRGHKI